MAVYREGDATRVIALRQNADGTFSPSPSGGTGSDVNVTNTYVTTREDVRQKTHVEFIPSSAAPTTIYKGYAPNGTADGTAAWTIQKFVFTGTTLIDETWTAVGTAIWNDRATATYT